MMERTNPADQTEHQNAEELLGAYIIDAVDPEERATVEAHLSRCVTCRGEVDALRSTLGMLANEGGPAPAGIWDRIEDEINGSGDVVAFRPPQRSRLRIPTIIASTALAVAAALTLIFGIAIHSLHNQVAELSTQVTTSATRAIATAALLQPGAKRFALDNPQGHTVGSVVALRSGEVVLTSFLMHPLATNSTYQVWAIVDEKPISLGLLGSHPTVSVFHTGGHHAFEFAITVEPASGVAQPTGAPVATAAII
ncbi:MAG: anti-sigma factor domain-containing protein [Ferrimicrobium sp.]